jgi:GAF domain-containing protein/HAMP domain-containing protein
MTTQNPSSENVVQSISNQEPAQKTTGLFPYYSLRIKIMLAFSATAISIVLLTAYIFYNNLNNQSLQGFRELVSNAATLAALQQNGDELEQISSAQDSLYEKFRVQNLKIRYSNPQFIYVYTLSKDNEGFYFIVDAGEPGEENIAQFGERYEQPSTTLIENYDTMTEAVAEPDIYTDEYGSFISGYAPLFTSDQKRIGVIGIDINADVVIQKQKQLLNQTILIASLASGISILLGYLFASIIVVPITLLTSDVRKYAEGDFSFRTKVKSNDEIGKLASTFNEIASRLYEMVLDFELKVEERTKVLSKRTNQLQAVADVGKSITSFRSLSELLQQTTRLIHENFGYYHVGIFLLDERRQFAVLTATNSEGGKRMLERGHQLKVGETGIVGYVAESLKARIALDVGADAVFFNNPDLPATRSEIALPLVVGGQILGVLDVQSTEPNAFTEEDIAALQILAEQLAVAIQNANLFAETEKALEASRLAYGEISREAWIKILRNRPSVGYIATPPDITESKSGTVEPSIAKAIDTGDLILGNDGLTISVPIKVRGQSIGAIRLKKSDISEAWTQEETNLAVTLSDQLSSALESARLYQDSQKRAARESLVSDISARLSAVTQMDLIIRETVQELGETLGNASVTFQLLDSPNGHSPIEGDALSQPKGRENGRGKAGT